MDQNNNELVIERVIDAPRELVFKVWTDPKHFANWWGPKAYTNPVCELDPKPNGTIKIYMQGADGVIIPTGGMYREVIEPERLVFTSNAFFDETGTPHLETLNTVTFEEYEGKTKMTLRAVVVKATPEMDGPLSGMEAGWNESLDKLDVVVNTLKGEQL